MQSQVLVALEQLYSDRQSSDVKATRKTAGIWLEAFQKTPAAWGAADSLIRSDNLALEIKLFAAQTFRQKILYDYEQLEPTHRSTLRDSLIALLLDNFKNGPSPITTQLILALADLTILYTEWKNPVPHMMEIFNAKDQETVAILLDYLAMLAEEISKSDKFTIDRQEFLDRANHILAENANMVLSRLLSYLDSLNTTETRTRAHAKIFSCLYSWVRSGDIKIQNLASTPILVYAFQALDDDDLFDDATDLICECVHRIGRLIVAKENVNQLVSGILLKVNPLVEMLHAVKDDEDKVRGICRILVEVSEAFLELAVPNYDSFKVVIQGLLICSSYHDLDIVRIPFNFWYILSESLQSAPNQQYKPHWAHVYRQLIDIIITKFHYPADLKEWTASDREDFRDFRHSMGDVLKDSFVVVGEDMALARPLEILTGFVSGSNGVFRDGTRWQDVEAPLFALRAMGGLVSKDESKVLPVIMNLLPNLPPHPKVRYAAILVIGRFSHWTAEHSNFIPYQMTFISSGFQDKESVSAAALALKHLCESCGHLLIDYLSELHPFYTGVIFKLEKLEQREFTEAISHVLSAVPMNESLERLSSFCFPMAKRLHEIASAGKPTGGEEAIVKELEELLGILGIFFRLVCPKMDKPNDIHPVVKLLQDLWPVLVMLLDIYSSVPPVTHSVARLLRHSMENTKTHLLPLLPQIVNKIVDSYASTKDTTYLWIGKKLLEVYADEGGDIGKELGIVVEKMSEITFGIFREIGKLDDIPEIVEDYFMFLTMYLTECPNLFIRLPIISMIIQGTVACTEIENPLSLTGVLSFLADFLYLLAPNPNPTTKKKQIPPADAENMRKTYMTPMTGYTILGVMFRGVFFTFPRERDVVREAGDTIKQCIRVCFHDGGARECIEKVIDEVVPDDLCVGKEKEVFLGKILSCLEDTENGNIKNVVNEFAGIVRRRRLGKDRKG